MEQESIKLLYDELTRLKAKLNKARGEYNEALNRRDNLSAQDAKKRWKIAERELAAAASKCDRRRGTRVV